MHELGLCYGLSIYNQCDDGFEMFGFANSNENPEIINFYLNNIDYLRRFSVYFREKGRELMDTSEKNRLITPSNKILYLNNKDFSIVKTHQFLNQTKIKNFIGTQNNPNISLREAETIYYRLNGLTMKESAREMKISPRTIEAHINSVKRKYSNIFFPKTQISLKKEIFSYFNSEKLND